MTDSQAPQVSFTARVMAAVRALESMREDALFHDSLAAKLAGTEAIEKMIPVAKKNDQEGSPYVSVRTRFIDDFLRANASEFSQVVLLGAGLDTRAFRIGLASDTHVFEVDQKDVFEYKNSILEQEKPSCFRHVIEGDISQPAWSRLLLEEGFQPEKPSIWIVEGVLYYLAEPDVKALMILIQSLAAGGSVFSCDVVNAAVCNSDEDWAQYWQWGCHDPESFFSHYGWRAKAVQPGEAGACFGRYTFRLAPREEKEKMHLFLMTAVKEV